MSRTWTGVWSMKQKHHIAQCCHMIDHAEGRIQPGIADEDGISQIRSFVQPSFGYSW